MADMDDREKQRLFFGLEFGVRLLVAPAAHGTDRGLLLSFGVPFGW
jgi:hypothetical protein